VSRFCLKKLAQDWDRRARDEHALETRQNNEFLLAPRELPSGSASSEADILMHKKYKKHQNASYARGERANKCAFQLRSTNL